MSNYYTPDIWEFRKGFEYEICCEGKWFYRKAFPVDHEVLQTMLQDKDMRVKYLEDTDIEEFGFHKDLQRATIWGNFKGYHYTKKYYLEYCPFDIKGKFDKDAELIIKKVIENTQKTEQIFKGKIKNKSEFWILLKQLDIK